MTDRQTRRISWGFRDFDKIIGPIVPGRLYVIGARPSNGKSTLLLNMLDSWLESGDRPKVMVYWTEMTAEVAYKCWTALRLGMDVDDVLSGEWGKLNGDYTVDDLEVRQNPELAVMVGVEALRAEGRSQLEDGWIRFAPVERPSSQQIAEDVARYRPDVVVLDYLQRIGRAQRQDRFEAIGDAAIALQSLAIHEGVSVIVTSQFKRKGDDLLDKYRAPSLEDFKLAGEIEEAADVALGLFRLLRHDFSRADEAAVRSGNQALSEFAIPNTMGVRVLKHRYRGPAADAMVRLRIDGKRVTDYGKRYQVTQVPNNVGDAWEPAA